MIASDRTTNNRSPSPAASGRTRPAARRQANPAFTLIELLVVIGIIVLLVGLVMPTVVAVQGQATEMASLALLDSIAVGIGQYHHDFDAYPPARDASERDMNSAELICFFMLGYAEDRGDDALACSHQNTLFEDDGVDGFGWRVPRYHRGPQHGPYNGLEESAQIDKTEKYWTFVDLFGNPVYYGVYREGPDDFDAGRDLSLPGGDAYFQDQDGDYFNTDFVLMTEGNDNEWTAYRDEVDTDDLTNFLPR